ncbi:nucleoside hydrolase [Exidia glandulosa HHB12029]|uniref:Nucleoside hydrolase n=1 Tax=Exidia glandulosa HHB12029 TaxID=1314781 RepID=A0A165DHM2_EXIGL|nr:nucleoside hydrolase [Exidia glandulosa HHB12029]
MAHKVILDTDPGTDDVIALLLLLASPEVQLEAITGLTGNTDVDHAYNNVLKTYEVVRQHCNAHPEDAHRFEHLNGRPQTILSKGAAGPIAGEQALAEYFHGKDGLSNIMETHPEFSFPQPFEHPWLKETDVAAHDVILDILRREPAKSVTLLAVGPLTNVAKAYGKDPETLARVRRIVIMGGTFDAPGNTTAVAEFNIYADPYAAHQLFSGSSALPLLVVPLDITSQHTVSFSALILDDPKTLLQTFVSAILARPRRVLAALGYSGDVFEMHDPLAAYMVTMHAAQESDVLLPGFRTTWRDFVIERAGEHTRGMFVVDKRYALA